MNVITFSGKTCPKSDCRMINGIFYEVGDPKKKDSGDCYPIKKKSGGITYYKANSPKIGWDYSNHRYIIISETKDLIKGVVGYNSKKKDFEEGYFIHNPLENVEISDCHPYSSGYSKNHRCFTCPNEEVAKSMGAILNPAWGIWYISGLDSTAPKSYLLSKTKMFSGKVEYDEFDNVYNLNDVSTGHYSALLEKYANKVKVTPFSKFLKKYLDGWSFGAEFETAFGRLQTRDLYRNGLLPIKDGSIPNHEYVSLPYRNEKHFSIFENALETLQQTCGVNEKCSLHYHFGDKYKTMSDLKKKTFVVSLYMLYNSLQQEIWEMLPVYKKSNEYFKTKKQFKDHCKNLHSLGLYKIKFYNHDGTLNIKSINSAFERIFTFVNDGHESCPESNFKSRTHCKHGSQKWNINSRYYNLNFFNALFSNSYTFEFRAHSGTVNKEKSIAWLLICVSILRYAESNVKDILSGETKLSLDVIFDQVAINFGDESISSNKSKKLAQYLSSYVDKRKLTFMSNFFSNNIYGNEFKKDSMFSSNITPPHGWK